MSVAPIFRSWAMRSAAWDRPDPLRPRLKSKEKVSKWRVPPRVYWTPQEPGLICGI